ncbi:MAG TPA: AMP-binding protein [Streptosporangiaceae bacterium]|nr:AMP-binding protein [Streptosporangiaceae bacterium]
MTSTVWDEEFFRRRASEASGPPEPLPEQPAAAAGAPIAAKYATIAELLLARAEDDNTGLLFEDQRWSWRELVQEAAVRSALLQELRPADRPWHVGVLLENTPEYIFLIAGAALCGATVVGINPTRRGAELVSDIERTDCALIVTDTAYGHLLDGVQDHREAFRQNVVIFDAGSTDYARRLERHLGAVQEITAEGLDPRTTLLLLFTSGSTGAPKAVICSTGRWAFVCQVTPLQFTADDVAYNAMPIFHGNALMSALGPCLANGAAFAMRRRFSASGFGPDIRRFGATFFNYVGRTLAYVLAQPESPEEPDNRLRFGFGTEASSRDRAEFSRRYGCPLLESYGSSEGTCYIINMPGTPDGALGVPQRAFKVEIVGESGQVCPPARFDAAGVMLNRDEAIGEIVSRGAEARFEGYYKNPDASRERLRGGDFWTGDLGYRDEHGYFWYAGRTADWLRVDSENFAAAPVEQILARFAGVSAAAVYGVPDPVTGDLVMAALEIPGGEFDPAAFSSFLGQQADLGTKWAPRLVRITSMLPLTATHKISRPALRRLLWNGDDPVYERIGESYVLMTADRAAALEAEYAEHGRDELLRF